MVTGGFEFIGGTHGQLAEEPALNDPVNVAERCVLHAHQPT